MVDVGNVTDETDDYLATTAEGYHGPSAHAYEISMTQNMTTDEQNVTTDDNTINEYLAPLFALLIFKWTLCPFILTGNALTIIVIKKYVKKISPTHIGIAFLAIAGLFVGIVDLLNFIIYLMRGNSVQSEYIYGLMSWITLVATGLNMSAIFMIAFERCCLTTLWRLHQKHLTARRQVGLCVVFSVYFLVYATVLTLMADLESRYGVLVLKFKEKTVVVVYALCIPTYALITCALTFCYCRICLFLWKHRRTLVSNQNISSQNNFQKEKKTTGLIAIILTVYLTGTMPPFVYALITGNNPKFLRLELWEFFRFLWCTTSLVDIPIYAWKVPEFQEGYCKILCCLRKVRTIQVAPSTNVQPCVMNLPLEPRKEVENSGDVKNYEAASF